MCAHKYQNLCVFMHTQTLTLVHVFCWILPFPSKSLPRSPTQTWVLEMIFAWRRSHLNGHSLCCWQEPRLEQAAVWSQWESPAPGMLEGGKGPILPSFVCSCTGLCCCKEQPRSVGSWGCSEHLGDPIQRAGLNNSDKNKSWLKALSAWSVVLDFAHSWRWANSARF